MDPRRHGPPSSSKHRGTGDGVVLPPCHPTLLLPFPRRRSPRQQYPAEIPPMVVRSSYPNRTPNPGPVITEIRITRW